MEDVVCAVILSDFLISITFPAMTTNHNFTTVHSNSLPDYLRQEQASTGKRGLHVVMVTAFQPNRDRIVLLPGDSRKRSDDVIASEAAQGSLFRPFTQGRNC
jgi:hypothetical protein